MLAKLAVPVGVVAPINVVSVTVMAHVVVWFTTTDDGEHVTVVAVESLPKVIDVVPWLAR